MSTETGNRTAVFYLLGCLLRIAHGRGDTDTTARLIEQGNLLTSTVSPGFGMDWFLCAIRSARHDTSNVTPATIAVTVPKSNRRDNARTDNPSRSYTLRISSNTNTLNHLVTTPGSTTPSPQPRTRQVGPGQNRATATSGTKPEEHAPLHDRRRSDRQRSQSYASSHAVFRLASQPPDEARFVVEAVVRASALTTTPCSVSSTGYADDVVLVITFGHGKHVFLCPGSPAGTHAWPAHRQLPTRRHRAKVYGQALALARAEEAVLAKPRLGHGLGGAAGFDLISHGVDSVGGEAGGERVDGRPQFRAEERKTQ